MSEHVHDENCAHGDTAATNEIPTPEQMAEELLNIIGFLVESTLEELSAEKPDAEKLETIEANMNQVKSMFQVDEAGAEESDTSESK